MDIENVLKEEIADLERKEQALRTAGLDIRAEDFRERKILLCALLEILEKQDIVLEIQERQARLGGA